MKKIEFEDKIASKIYTDYITRIERVTKTLPQEDRNDILMEFNSHIYESIQHNIKGNETENLMTIIEKLGAPEEVLIPLIADKKLNQATKTYNPLHVFKALALNITNGISYVIFSLLYLMLFCFVFLIYAKIVQPENTGMFFDKGHFKALGMSSNKFGSPTSEEVLGNWFIPFMLVTIIGLYLLITFMLKLKRKLIK